MVKKALPIGNDSFSIIREKGWYYVDKSLMIKDFIEFEDTVTLITRPRRFGKTLNMTMLREFFDITKNSKSMFNGLKIMNTEFANHINSKPVIFFSFKDCSGKTKEDLKFSLIEVLLEEYIRFNKIFENDKKDIMYIEMFMNDLELLKSRTLSFNIMKFFIKNLIRIVNEYYKIAPILLIDEYDQPILSSCENGYHNELDDFFSIFYGSALKGNEYLGQALLTGIQRVAKESIFSKLNNILVYSLVSKEYGSYFGLTTDETKELLKYYGLELNDLVKRKYDGYHIGDYEMYNPWSVFNYAKNGELGNYWINTSTNYLIKQALIEANEIFKRDFDRLIQNNIVDVSANLEISFIELQDNDALWGLLVNSGYVTVLHQENEIFMTVCIPNDEVKSEFQKIVAEQA